MLFMQEWLLSVMFCSVNSTIPREPAPASFIFKVQCPICIVVLQQEKYKNIFMVDKIIIESIIGTERRVQFRAIGTYKNIKKSIR